MAMHVSWSASKASKSSSLILTNFREVGLVGEWVVKLSNNQSMEAQFDSKPAKFDSIFSSFWAWSVMSSTATPNSCKFNANNPPNINSSSSYGGTNSLPVAVINIFQWRGRIDLCRKATIKGHVAKKSLTFCSVTVNTLHHLMLRF